MLAVVFVEGSVILDGINLNIDSSELQCVYNFAVIAVFKIYISLLLQTFSDCL